MTRLTAGNKQLRNEQSIAQKHQKTFLSGQCCGPGLSISSGHFRTLKYWIWQLKTSMRYQTVHCQLRGV